MYKKISIPTVWICQSLLPIPPETLKSPLWNLPVGLPCYILSSEFVSHSTVDNWSHHHHTTTVLRPFFRDHPGWASTGRELLDLCCKGRLTEADILTIRMGTIPSGLTKQCPPPPSPKFFTGRMPFLPPNQQHQSTKGTKPRTEATRGLICFFSYTWLELSTTIAWVLSKSAED